MLRAVETHLYVMSVPSSQSATWSEIDGIGKAILKWAEFSEEKRTRTQIMISPNEPRKKKKTVWLSIIMLVVW